MTLKTESHCAENAIPKPFSTKRTRTKEEKTERQANHRKTSATSKGGRIWEEMEATKEKLSRKNSTKSLGDSIYGMFEDTSVDSVEEIRAIRRET